MYVNGDTNTPLPPACKSHKNIIGTIFGSQYIRYYKPRTKIIEKKHFMIQEMLTMIIAIHKHNYFSIHKQIHFYHAYSEKRKYLSQLAHSVVQFRLGNTDDNCIIVYLNLAILAGINRTNCGTLQVTLNVQLMETIMTTLLQWNI